MDLFARPLLLANLVGIWAYVALWQGGQRFFYESCGTLIISPIIYTRICPAGCREPLIRAFAGSQILTWVVTAVPVAMILVALGFGFVAFRKKSFPTAVVACVLISSVFVVYHSVKHLGMVLELY
jgi:hypothetical protein